MPGPGKVAFIYPNIAIVDGAVTSSSNDDNGADSNVLTERVDSYWSPVDFSVARDITLTLSGSYWCNCVWVPHVYISGDDPELVEMDTLANPGSVSTTGTYHIQTGAVDAANEDLDRPNYGLETVDYSRIIARHRFSSFRTFTAAKYSTLKLTFTPDTPVSAVLRVPCIVPGWFFQPDRGLEWSGVWDQEILQGGHVRRTFNWSLVGQDRYHVFSRWYRQWLIHGSDQKWAMLFAPDWKDTHYETALWGYMHDFKVQMMGELQGVYRVSGRIVESLNSEGRP